MECRLLSDVLIRDLDQALCAAVHEVEENGVAQVQVGMTFTVKMDEDEGGPIVGFVHKSTTTQKGEFRPGSVGQLRLPHDHDIESVTFAGAGKSVTLGKK